MQVEADDTLDYYRAHGWMRVTGAFDAQSAEAMRAAIWRLLASAGIAEDRPESWTVERPTHLQQLKNDPVFRTVGSERLRKAIDTALDGRPWSEPRDWGACFVAFPIADPWSLPASGWHIDANYRSPLWPAGGVKTFALLGDTVPQGGGTLIVSGSHRLVNRWFAAHAPPPEARSADLRKHLLALPYLRDLQLPGEREMRIARFMARGEEVEGVPLRVVELIGRAGDVYLLHPLIMHAAAPNVAAAPRFLLSGGITTDQWGWA